MSAADTTKRIEVYEMTEGIEFTTGAAETSYTFKSPLPGAKVCVVAKVVSENGEFALTDLQPSTTYDVLFFK